MSAKLRLTSTPCGVTKGPMETTLTWCDRLMPWGYMGAGAAYPTARHPVVPTLCKLLNDHKHHYGH